MEKNLGGYTNRVEAKLFFEAWVLSINEVAAPPLIKVLKMLEQHIDIILIYYNNTISNGVSKGLNRKIQFIKSYRTRVLFYAVNEI